ncbi:heme oxygenase-like protein [Marasmius fiardii PR-910]|nr:heme oxygenase-like protein [Marasmius fiardii PR-910]
METLQSQSRPSLTQHLLDSSTKFSYDAAIKHDFLTSAGTGTLDHNLLALWLSQDKIYAMRGYPRFIGSLIAKMAHNPPRVVNMTEEDSYHFVLKALIFCMENIGREIDFFKTTAEKWDLDLTGWQVRKGTEDYLNEMDRVVREYGPGIEHGLVFLWAMERVYLDAWTYVNTQLHAIGLPPSHSLTISATTSFAINWSSKEFVAFVDRLGSMVDSLDIAPESPTWKGCEDIWSKVVELEVYFWPEKGEERTQRKPEGT